MDTTANIIFRSISAIYESAISGGALHPTLYFDDNDRDNTFHGFRLSEVIPTRLVIRTYEEGKSCIVDMLWLVDDSKIEGKGCVTFYPKNKDISVKGGSKAFISAIQSDATISACYKDLIEPIDFFEKVTVGTKNSCPSKLQSESKLNLSNLPTNLFAFSRSHLNLKKIKNESYQDVAINGFLAIIDLIHRSLEILSTQFQKKSDSEGFCIRCGEKLPSDSYFCPICGTKQG
jgi:hypothetical protein